MKRKQIFAALLACLVFIMVAFFSSVKSSPKINELYVFGDSLSDVGNVFRTTGGTHPSSPPYFQGRYSNGRVWVEYLASELALTLKQNTNFAYGGATIINSNNQGIPSLLSQIYSLTKAHPKVNPNALYVLWAGANDYLYGFANPQVSIDNLSQAVQSLSKAGAQKILVANLPDLGRIPATQNTAYSNVLSSVTISHNLGLAKELDSLSKKLGSNTEILRLDVNSLYREAITNPAKFGFTNVTNACLNNKSFCEHPDKFLFWDGIHPTTAAHRILGQAAVKTLAKTPSQG